MNNDTRHRAVPRSIAITLCLLAVASCLLYAYLRPDLPRWWKMVGGGVPYVVFWITLWFVGFPRRRYILPICIGVVVFTCFLEALQLWNPEPLATFRDTKFGAAWLGKQFAWDDIPPYLIGGVVGYTLLWAACYFFGAISDDDDVHQSNVNSS